MSRKTLPVSCLLLVLFSTTALACLWDSDTLQMERLRFPGVLEIITGKFVRHSKAYYEWRIVDRKQKLASKPNDPALIDDLAVAYAKLGRPEEGIPLLEQALQQHPDRYETLSNLGTLLFFAGRLDESKQHIRRALEINPDAHFGREQYQLLLTEYLQHSDYRTTGIMSSGKDNGFDKWILKGRDYFGRDIKAKKQMQVELQSALKGVLGMMHFANFESPILLEALGDLLRHGFEDENATLLAARAYFRAAQFAPNHSAAEKFRQQAEQQLRGFLNPPALESIQKELEIELEAAQEWFAKIEANERRWITDNRDVDREFAAVYYDSLDTEISVAQEALKQEQNEEQQRQIEQEREWRKAQVMAQFPAAADGHYYYYVLLIVVLAIGVAFLAVRRRKQRGTSTILHQGANI